jgi:hypothetical protein
MIELEYSGVFDQSFVVEWRTRIAHELENAGVIRRRANRVLAIFVEMAQNIHRYSIESEIGRIRVSASTDSVVLCATNAIDPSTRDAVERKVRKVAEIDKENLQTAIRRRRRGNPTERGAGLGLLEIARLSDVGVQWRITDIDERVVLEFLAEVNLGDVVKDLNIERLSDTLGITCCATTGVVELTGESYPEDAFSFFGPVSEWIAAYLKSDPDSLTLVCTIGYLNSSSSKCLFDLFDAISQLKLPTCTASVTWLYEEGDEDNREVGEEFAEDVTLPFTLKAYT